MMCEGVSGGGPGGVGGDEAEEVGKSEGNMGSLETAYTGSSAGRYFLVFAFSFSLSSAILPSSVCKPRICLF